MLVTEMKGNLFIVPQQGKDVGKVAGVPDVDYGGQGGLGDVALHPKFDENRLVYLSYAEGGPVDAWRSCVRAVLEETEDGAELSDVEVIWRQYPKQFGHGHYGHRLLFDDDGYLWISSGDRQQFTPSQDMQSNLGKILRLHDDGSIPKDNPFVDYPTRKHLSTTSAFMDRSGRLGIAIRSASPSISKADCGGQKWGPRAVTS